MQLERHLLQLGSQYLTWFLAAPEGVELLCCCWMEIESWEHGWAHYYFSWDDHVPCVLVAAVAFHPLCRHLMEEEEDDDAEVQEDERESEERCFPTALLFDCWWML